MIILAIIGLILVIIDQILKHISLKKFKLEEKEILNKHIVFTYLENDGAMFGLFKNKKILVLIISLLCLAAIILLFIFYIYPLDSILINTGITLLLAGALSNIIDRIFRSHVIDFIYFQTKKRKSYVFNFGDFYIFIGIIIIIIGEIIYE